MMKGDNMSAVFWVQQCHWGKDETGAGGFIRLMGVMEDRSGWCVQNRHVKGINNALVDGITRRDPIM